jgi:5'-nucleotidase
MQKKPYILLTNDDGIEAPGLAALYQAVCSFADTVIVAPASEQSGVGAGISLRNPLQIQTVLWPNNANAWKVTGTPADCVRLGLHTILKRSPDLILSGVNRGSNAGRTVLYSGTVGAVIEGIMKNVPGIAFSSVDYKNPKYEQFKEFIQSIVSQCLTDPLPKGTLLNVNFPNAEKFQGIKLAHQGMSYWMEDPEQRLHPEGHEYYWLGGKWSTHPEDQDSDVYLLEKGYITAVPIHVNQLTDKALVQERKQLFEHSVNSGLAPTEL